MKIRLMGLTALVVAVALSAFTTKVMNAPSQSDPVYFMANDQTQSTCNLSNFTLTNGGQILSTSPCLSGFDKCCARSYSQADCEAVPLSNPVRYRVKSGHESSGTYITKPS